MTKEQMMERLEQASMLLEKKKDLELRIQKVRKKYQELGQVRKIGILGTDVRYDRNRKVWRGWGDIPDEIPEMSSKRRRDFENIVHFEKILFEMNCLTVSEIDRVLDELHVYQDSQLNIVP